MSFVPNPSLCLLRGGSYPKGALLFDFDDGVNELRRVSGPVWFEGTPEACTAAGAAAESSADGEAGEAAEDAAGAASADADGSATLAVGAQFKRRTRKGWWAVATTLVARSNGGNCP